MTRDEYINLVVDATGKEPTEEQIKKYVKTDTPTQAVSTVIPQETKPIENKYQDINTEQFLPDYLQTKRPTDVVSQGYEQIFNQAQENIVDSGKNSYQMGKQIVKDALGIQNTDPNKYIVNSERMPKKVHKSGFLYGAEKGQDDSLPSMVDDVYEGRKGGSGYRLHPDSWSRKLLSSPLAREDVLTDLGYITGKTVVDIPVVLGLSAITGGVFGKGYLASLAAGSTGFGAYTGASSAAQQKRDMGEVDLKQTAKDAAIGAATYVPMALTGGAFKAANPILGSIAKKVVPVAVADSAIVNAGTTALGTVARVAAENEAQARTQAKLEGRKVTAEDRIMGLSSAVLGEAMMKGVEHVTPEKIGDGSYVSPKDRVIGDRIENVTTQTNALKIKKEIDTAREKGIDKIDEHVFENEFKRWNDAEEIVNAKSQGETKAKSFLNDRELKDRHFTEVAKEIEFQTGQPSKYIDPETGTIKKPYLYNRKELQDFVSGEYNRVLENDSYLTGIDSLNDIKQANEYAQLNKRLLDLSGDTRTMKEVEKATGVNKNSYVKATSKLIGTSKRLEATKRHLDKMELEPHTKNQILKDLETTPEAMKNLVGKSNFWKMSRLEKLTKYVRNPIYQLEKMGGSHIAQFVMQSARVMDAYNTKVTRKKAAEIYDLSSKLSVKEMNQVVINALAKNVRRSKDKEGKPIFKNEGERIIKKMKEKGLITDEDIISADQFNDRQQAFAEYMSNTYKDIWERYNDAREAMGYERVEGLPNYLPLFEPGALKDGNLSDPGMTPWLVSKKIEQRDIAKKVDKRKGGVEEIDLDGAELLVSYMSTMERKINTAFVAKKNIELAEMLHDSGRKDLGEYIHGLSKYWAGDYVDPTLPPWARKAVNWANNNMYVSLLSFGISSVVSNSMTFTASVAEFGPERIYKAMTDVAESRASGDVSNHEMSAVLGSRTWATVDSKLQGVHNSSFMNKAKTNIAKKGMSAMEMVDGFWAEVTFKAAYDYYTAEKNMSHDDAIYRAGEMVNKTQGSGGRLDLAPVHRGSLGKMFLSFGTFPLANLNYLVHKAYGVDPVYKYESTFKTKDEAQRYAEHNDGYEVFEIEPKRGKPEYVAYHKERAMKSMDIMKRVLLFSVVNAATGILLGQVEDKTGIKIQTPGVDIAGRAYQEATQDGFKKNDRRKKFAKAADIAIGTVQEMTKAVPMIGSIANFGSGAGGSALGSVERVGKDIQKFKKDKSVINLAQLANDSTILFGNPLYNPVRYLLNWRKDVEREERARRRRLR